MSDTNEVAQPEINLRKFKVEKLGLYLEYQTGEGEGYADMTAKYLRPAHQDLLDAVAALVPHLCFMTDLVSSGVMHQQATGPMHEWPEFAGYKVTGASLSPTGVVLIGQKKLRGGKVLNLITPHEVLEPEQEVEGEYAFLPELKQALDAVEIEVLAYLEGKTAGLAQQTLDFSPAA